MTELHEKLADLLNDLEEAGNSLAVLSGRNLGMSVNIDGISGSVDVTDYIDLDNLCREAKLGIEKRLESLKDEIRKVAAQVAGAK